MNASSDNAAAATPGKPIRPGADWHLHDDLAAGRLVDLFPQHEVTATTFDTAAWLLYPSRSYLPHKVRATIEFLRKHLRKERVTRARVRAHKRA